MSKYTGMEIAIIGCSGRFPGANNIYEFWENLKKGVESISSFEDDELLNEGETPGQLSEEAYVKRGAYVSGKEYFDAELFGFLPAEAKVMDPQIRIFLEECWSTLQDAGYGTFQNTEKIGLFAGGASNINWSSHAILSQDEDVDEYTASQLRDVSFLCSRIAYLLNLQGPTMYINTACSTSLVAVQRAVMSLLLRECKMALAGGITIKNHSKKGYLYQEGMIQSDDGHCRPFDAKANGTVSSEGAGVVMLKRLQDALEDKDHIYAIIKGAAVNNDGHNKISFTAPSVEGQSETILKALNMAKVPASTISYVEAHGTATTLGDPIEVEALNLAFGKSDNRHCALGSVKSNIGHTDAAAGVAGLIKTVLALKHKQLPPSLHFETPNPKINLEKSAFYVNSTLLPWKANGTPLRAGVSSFGIGGTNAHVVLEEAPAMEISYETGPQLLVISGNTPGALERNSSQLADYLYEHPEVSLLEVAYTLQVGRQPFRYRLAIPASDREEAIKLLEAPKSRIGIEPTPVDKKIKVIWMFSGQGSQYWNMSRDLYEQEEYFKEVLDQCLQKIQQAAGKDMKPILFGLADEYLINETQYTQPLLFAIEYSLARLLQHWGLHPDGLIGHSIGEYAAACLGGVMSLDDAIRLVVKRGQLMQTAPKGSMLSVSLTAIDIKPYLSKFPDLGIAAINTEEATVVSGADEAIEQLILVLQEDAVPFSKLHTSHAFHSPMMEGILEDFRREIQTVNLAQPKIPIANNLTGDVSVAMKSHQYWVDQIVNPVQFAKGLTTLTNPEPTIFVEIGPGKTLSAFVNLHPDKQPQHKVVNLMRHPKETFDDQKYLYRSLGKIWSAGVLPDWKAFHKNEPRKVALPTYSFEKTEYPVHVNAYRLIQDMIGKGSESKDTLFSNWIYRPAWKISPLDLEPEIPESPVLIFLDEGEVGQKVAATFKDQGTPVIMISRDQAFKKISDDHFCGSGTTGDMKLLFNHLKEQGVSPGMLVYCWSITDTKAHKALLESCYLSLHAILTAMSDSIGLFNLQLAAITNETFDVLTPQSGNSSEKGMTSSLLKVIGQEYPSVTPSLIDIGSTEIDDVQLFREIIHREKGKVVALHHGHRFVQIYEQLKHLDTVDQSSRLKQGGVYLITGGLGSLGYALAEHLLKRYQAHVLLIGRQEVDGEPKNNSVKSQRLNALEQLPGTVKYVACDVTDQPALNDVISEAEDSWGVLNGVVHAAGIVEGHTHALGDLDTDHIKTQLAPKVNGLRSLSAVLEDKELDFCLLTSSLASILGGVGFGAYAPANGFMDHFAQDPARRKWLSLNLDGLSLDKQSEEDINLKEFIDVVELVLSMNAGSQLIVSTRPLETRLQKWVSLEQEQPDQHEIDEVTQTGETRLEDMMLKVWKKFFGRETITITDDFFEIGGDSLKALTMVNRMQQLLGISITIGEFFNRPTIGELAKLMSEKNKELPKQAETYVAIPKAPVQATYPLSSAQKRLYFLWEFDPNSIAYNVPMVRRLKGDLDTERFLRIFEKILARHDCLRTVFRVENDLQVQRILESVDYQIEEFSGVEQEAAPIVQGFIRPFDLSSGPMIRVGLMKLLDAKQEFLLLVDIHHIITDGVSMSVLIQEFMRLYEGQQLDEPALRYVDFAHWQQSTHQQERIREQQAFWINQFAELPEALDLPTDRKRPLLKSHRGGTVDFSLDAKQTQTLREIADSSGTTMYMVILAIYNVFLSKLTNQKDIVIGTPVAGRPHADLETVMGVFANALPIRNQLSGGQRFSDFLQVVKNNLIDCFENQEYPYEELIDQLQLVRDTSRNPLFDVEFSYENFEQTRFEIDGVQISEHPFEYEIAQFDLALTALEKDDIILLDFEYARDLFEESTVWQFVTYFKRVVTAVAEDANRELSSILILSEQQRSQMLKEINEPADQVPAPTQTVLDLFMAQAAISPHKKAITFEDQDLTYEELDTHSTILAQRLLTAGITSQSVVAILLDRSVEMIVSVLAVVKSGASYLPMDLLWPTARIKSILRESQAEAIIAMPSMLENEAVEIKVIDPTLDSDQGDPIRDWTKPRLQDPVYVIYTSGSTGKPKGVVVGHETLANYIQNQIHAYGISSDEKILQFTTLSFDPASEQIWLALTSGATLVLVNRMLLSNNDQFNDYLIGKEVTHLHATPSYLSTISLRTPNPLRRIVAGGETCDWSLVEKFDQCHFFNKYGPTEATISVAQFRVDGIDDKSITVPIGKSLAGAKLYVLDGDLNLLLPGVSGELYVGGPVLAKGYFNDESLTSQRFVTSPFRSGEILYKTGDKVRTLPNGNLEFVGRKDKQVKIRGHRIEMGEIEHHLNQLDGVTQAIVTVLPGAEEPTLIAYYVESKDLDQIQLQDHLKANLPDYMVPPHLVGLPEIPLTPNQKVDYKALPEPNTQANEKVEGPSNETEETLLKLWAEVLKKPAEEISVTSGFFELGGHSLNAIILISRIQKQFNTKIQLTSFFKAPTIRDLGQSIVMTSLSQTSKADMTKKVTI